jgi:acyl-CoA synthetase (NDP forming)
MGSLGYRGKVFPVSREHELVSSLKCYPSLREVPGLPDAVIVTERGAEAAVAAVEESARFGVGGAVVLTGGFAEAGPRGKGLQDRLREAARQDRMALMGPNCQGFINCLQPSALWTGDIVEALRPGSIAFISPSGAVCTGVVNQFHRRGAHVSYAASIGNEAGVSAADLIEVFAADRQTRVIAVHLETIHDAERFFAACDHAAEAGTPVVVLKVGRSHAAAEAIQSHTGALAGPDRLIDAQFRRHGITRVQSIDELVETCIAFLGRRIVGPRVAAFASAGAHIGLLLDAAASTSLRFPTFEPGTAAKLTEGLPESDRISARNPFDGGSTLRGALETIAADPSIDVALFITQTRRRPVGVVDILTAYLELAEKLHDMSQKPVTVLSANSDVEPSISARLVAKGIPVVSGVEMGLRALEHVYLYSYNRSAARPTQQINIDRDALRHRLGVLRRPLTGQPALVLLSELGLPTINSKEVHSVGEAVVAAEEYGYPVVVKTGAATVLHKSEMHQVFLNLTTPDAVRNAAVAVTPPILVQPQVAGGIELLVGLQSDPDIGTCVVVGAGGVLTELLASVAVRPVPLGVGDAAEMLAELAVDKMLDGYRGSAPIDRVALVTLIDRVAELGAAAGSTIRSLDLNPVLASPTGTWLVDALLIPGDEPR